MHHRSLLFCPWGYAGVARIHLSPAVSHTIETVFSAQQILATLKFPCLGQLDGHVCSAYVRY